MSICEKFIRKIEKKLPEICTVKDLIEAGLYNSRQAARSARLTHTSPPFFKCGKKKIFFSRDGVVRWLREGYHECEMSNTAKKTADFYESNGLEVGRGQTDLL